MRRKNEKEYTGMRMTRAVCMDSAIRAHVTADPQFAFAKILGTGTRRVFAHRANADCKCKPESHKPGCGNWVLMGLRFDLLCEIYPWYREAWLKKHGYA